MNIHDVIAHFIDGRLVCQICLGEMYISVVFPENICHFTSTKDWKSKVWKDGSSVTHGGTIYQLLNSQVQGSDQEPKL